MEDVENKDPFASYYKSGEPDKAARAYAWQTAIGLQKVDNLQTSAYLMKTAHSDSVPAEYVGRDVAVVAMDSILAAYCDGKQIAMHRLSCGKKDMVMQPQHYSSIKIKERIGMENPLLEQDPGPGLEHVPQDLSRYDEALYG